MSRESERELITAHFAAHWNNADGTIAWPNHEFTTPSNALFVVFNLVDRGTTRETIGRTYVKRSRGTLQVDIYTPSNAGIKKSREIAQRLEDVYDSLDLVTVDGETVNFYTPTSRQIADNEKRAANLDDNWDRYVVECPYTRQMIVSK